jgi:hypothetical protein
MACKRLAESYWYQDSMTTQCLSLHPNLRRALQITLAYVPALFLHIPSKSSNGTFPPQSQRTFNAQTHP